MNTIKIMYKPLFFKNKIAAIKNVYKEDGNYGIYFLIVVIIAILGAISLVSSGIVYNGITLVDSTVYNATSNICTASRYGMSINISPCNAGTINGKNIVQDVNFKWTGGSPQKVSWVFVYDGVLEAGKVDLQQNESYSYNETVQVNAWANNFPVNDINLLINLGTPTEFLCEVGNANNTQMYKVNQSTYNGIVINSSKLVNYCFTNSTAVNATSYLISGNYWADSIRQVNTTRLAYNDVGINITYMGYGLLNDSRAYYQVQNVTFQPNVPIATRWIFTPQNKSKSGKWHIFGYDSAVSISDAINSNVYIYLDPSWNSTYTDGLQYYLNYNNTSPSNATFTQDIYKGILNGTPMQGATSGATGILGEAYTYDGIDDYITYGTSDITYPSTGGSWSMNIWVKPVSTQNGGVIISKNGKAEGGKFALWFGLGDTNPGTNYEFVYSNTWIPAQFGIISNAGYARQNNTWSMITVTKNATGVTLYKNGTYAGSSNTVWAPTWVPDNNQTMTGNGSFYWGGKPFKGEIDEYNTWNRTLTVDEVVGLYNGGVGITYSEPAVASGFPINVTSSIIYHANQTLTKNTTIIFSANATSVNANLTNITLFVWYSNNTIFNETTIPVLGYNLTNSTTFTITNFVTGNFSFNAYGCDKNTTDSDCQWDLYGNRTIQIDATIPTINFTFPTSVSKNQSSTSLWFNISAVDAYIDTIILYLYNSLGLFGQINSSVGAIALFNNFTGLADGDYNVNASVNDTFGNINYTETRGFTIDSIKPIINFTSPISKSTNQSSTSIFINVSSTDINKDTIIIYLYNSTDLFSQINSSNGAVALFNNFTGLIDGNYYFNASANDTAGNINYTETRAVTIDTVKPAINFTSPTSLQGTQSYSSIWANISSTDINKDTIIIYLYSSTGLVQQINSSNGAVALFNNFTALTDDIYSINASANDTAGNINYSDTRTFTIDTTKPVINFTFPIFSNNTITSNTTMRINVTATDTYLANITVYLYNSTRLWNTSTTGTSPNYIQFNNLPDDVYYVNASANDTMNNINWTETRQFTIDTIAPALTVVKPVEDLDTADWSINFTLTATDIGGSGISTYLYAYDGGSNNSFTGTGLINVQPVGGHTVIFCVNDTADNFVCSGTYNFTTYQATGAGGGPGGGGGAGVTIISSANITFAYMNFTFDNWITHSTNYIIVNTKDKNGNNVDVDLITISLLTSKNLASNNITHVSIGKYKQGFYIEDTNATNVTLVVYAKQGTKTSQQNINILMTPATDYQILANNAKTITSNVMRNSIDFISANWLIFIGLAAGLIILVIFIYLGKMTTVLASVKK